MEMHMFAGCLHLGKHLDGYTRNGLVNLSELQDRHDRLAREMQRRGLRHHSPLQVLKAKGGFIDVASNLRELARRCVRCRELQKETR